MEPKSSRAHAHHFACHLVWTGAASGGTTSYERYSREVRTEVVGKPPLALSAAPAFQGDAALLNPEDLLVASLSSCHFLSYAALCARSGIVVLAYEDDARGTMDRVDGVTRFTEVVLRPKVTLAPGADAAKARALHERAHAICFIANSVDFDVRNEPTIVFAPPSAMEGLRPPDTQEPTTAEGAQARGPSRA
jgi:organic hydroperoxide reductase OsmC/OhrA